MGAPRLRCPVCNRLVAAHHERKDQRGLAQDLRVIAGHGDGRRCPASGKRLAPDDPRLLPGSIYSKLSLENERMRDTITRLRRELEDAQGRTERRPIF